MWLMLMKILCTRVSPQCLTSVWAVTCGSEWHLSWQGVTTPSLGTGMCWVAPCPEEGMLSWVFGLIWKQDGVDIFFWILFCFSCLISLSRDMSPPKAWQLVQWYRLKVMTAAAHVGPVTMPGLVAVDSLVLSSLPEGWQLAPLQFL